MALELVLDDVAEGVVGQVHRGVDHVRVDGQQGAVGGAEHGGVVLVPDVLGNAVDGIAQLGGRGFGMAVEPLPGVHVGQGHSHDLVGAPEDVEGGVVVHRVVEAEELEVALLEDEGEGLGVSGVGYAVEHVVIDVVEVEGLLDVVAELMDGDVVALVVHALLTHAGTQTGGFPASGGSPGVTGAAGGLDYDAVSQIAGVFGGEAESPQHTRHVVGKCLGVGVFGAGHPGQFVLGHGRAALEAVVPDVVGPQVAAQALADDGGHLFYLGRGDQMDEQLLDVLSGHFHAFLEVAGDAGGQLRAVEVDLLFHMEGVEDMRVAHVGLGLELHFLAVLPGLVGIGCPVVSRVVHHVLRDGLVHDAEHHLEDHLLFLVGIGDVGVVALELVAQVPVREQHHVLGEEAAAVIGEEVPHHDVVGGNVVLGGAAHLRVLGVDGGRYAGGEGVSHAGVGPFEAAPLFSEGILLLKGVEGEIEV